MFDRDRWRDFIFDALEARPDVPLAERYRDAGFTLNAYGWREREWPWTAADADVHAEFVHAAIDALVADADATIRYLFDTEDYDGAHERLWARLAPEWDDDGGPISVHGPHTVAALVDWVEHHWARHQHGIAAEPYLFGGGDPPVTRCPP